MNNYMPDIYAFVVDLLTLSLFSLLWVKKNVKEVTDSNYIDL